MTCKYRCGDACFHEVPNTSDNAYFGDIVTDMSRRGALRAGALGALVLSAGAVAAAAATPAAADDKFTLDWWNKGATGTTAAPTPTRAA